MVAGRPDLPQGLSGPLRTISMWRHGHARWREGAGLGRTTEPRIDDDAQALGPVNGEDGAEVRVRARTIGIGRPQG